MTRRCRGSRRTSRTSKCRASSTRTPPDLKEYGLAEPRVDVTFKAAGQEHTLLIGQKTPPGSDFYAKRGNDKKVFLIASYLDSTFNRKTFDLRDKTAIRVDRDKLDALEIVTAGDARVRFAKAERRVADYGADAWTRGFQRHRGSGRPVSPGCR